ncbi:enoyl-acyl-carrier-proteinreductase 1 mitochondrial precursor [Zalerion maritima]|uniref:enoyl-[acyl-carrier-protein] reductase n=1 Tax=Zalerion maritima TaxID=339359 RepID=A0AAD5RWX1_9PEZI|nr:enoyl-acyl-carrier-proteinreductase 1 mitochondrial precursor [Zalerion maritima]
MPFLRLALRHARASRVVSSRGFATTRTLGLPGSGEAIEAQALTFSEFGDPQKVLRLTPHKIKRSAISTGNSLLLRTLAAPVNPADINVVQGTYGALPRFIPSAFGRNVESVEPPVAIPGNEGVFEVLEAGVDVDKEQYAPGDWVLPVGSGYGTWRTHVLTTSSDTKLWKIPSYIRNSRGLTVMQAATATVNPLTALKLLHTFGANAGDWVLQNGANSAVGRLVIQLAKLNDIKTLNVVRERETPRETEQLRGALQALGADVVVTDSQLGRELAQILKDVSGGKGAKLMFDCVGGSAATSLAKSLNPDGKVITYGAMSKKPMMPGAGMLIFKGITFEGFWVSKWGERFPRRKKESLEYLLNQMASGNLQMGATAPVPWRGDELRLVDTVGLTLEGKRRGKSVFVFPDDGELDKPSFGLDAQLGKAVVEIGHNERPEGEK